MPLEDWARGTSGAHHSDSAAGNSVFCSRARHGRRQGRRNMAGHQHTREAGGTHQLPTAPARARRPRQRYGISGIRWDLGRIKPRHTGEELRQGWQSNGSAQVQRGRGKKERHPARVSAGGPHTLHAFHNSDRKKRCPSIANVIIPGIVL